MTATSVQKQALGRVSHLGHLYDERTESFLGFSLFNREINEKAIKRTAIPFTDISYLICGSTSQKLQKLSVETQLKLSVMCDLISLDGSGKYLSEQHESSKSYRADLFFKTTTVLEEIDIAKLSAEEINENCLKRNATHVVVSIKWVANVIGSFEYEAKEDEKNQDIKG